MNRILKYVNILIALLVAVLLVGIYWLAWRPLPQVSGTIPAPISRTATVTRDALGVPHIRAASEEDALFVQGYVTAQDRLWQMDGLRRLSGGDLSEIVGPAALDSDKQVRRLRLRRIAEAAYISLPGHDRAALAAYARGVNFFMSTHLGRLPLEFTLLKYDPQPWSVIDSILIGLHMYRTLTTTWPDKIQKGNLLSGGDPAKVNFLFPVRTGMEIPPGSLLPLGSELQPGSNAWAISGSRTASGKPLLSNDPHLEYSIPGIWFAVHLEAPGLNVAGVSLPGAPGVILGHNDRIAWGATNLHFDAQDLYIERFDDRTGRYQFRGKIEQAQPERDVIRVKGAPNFDQLNWVTVHGPIFLSEGQQRLALRWTAAEPGAFQFPFLELNRARDWNDFLKALSRYPGPGQNWVYADVDGNIGYHAAGRLPIRKNYAGDIPVDGASGNYEWQGFIPFDRLPSSYNPPEGMIITANQNPFPADYPYPVHGNFAPHYRSKQIRDLLAGRKGLRPEDTLAVQKDVYSAFSHYLAGALVRACENRKVTNPDLTDPVMLLRGWNGQMDKDRAAPFIVALAFQYVRKAVADSASPGKGTVYETQMAPAVIEALLRTRPPGWFRDYDEMLLKAFADAVDEARRMQGRDARKWVFGKYLTLLITHPVGHQLPWVARYFDIGPVPMSGSSTAVKQTTARLGPSMRMNADLADWDRSLLNLTAGESGHVLSRHYKDQWDAYYNARSFPMQFRKVTAKNVVEFVPTGQ